MITVLIPAHDEAGYIGPCLDLLRLSDDPRDASGACVPVHVIVIANGCSDATAAEASARAASFAARGWRFDVIDRPEPGKTGALNAGEALAGPMRPTDMRVYLDADLQFGPALIAALATALVGLVPAYAAGRLTIRPPRSAFSRAYARFWLRLPFMADGVPGSGIFAVNAAGRARWGAFPTIIADDAFVRLQFAPHERHGVTEPYVWPIAEGFGALVRVRRRQDRGLAELRATFPSLFTTAQRTAPAPTHLLRLALRDPFGFAAYAGVALATRLTRPRRPERWARGR